MGDGLPAPATSAGPNQWPMENIALNNNNSTKKSKTGRWFSGSGNTTAKVGWFKNPRDTSWTIDTVVNGKTKPAGYDSNTLITVVRSSQCFCAGMTLIFYVATTSAPAKWLFILAIAVGAISFCWSMCVLWMRHIWSAWLVIPELLITFAWMVLYGINTTAKPDESKAETFRVAMIAIEASMVLWIQTCLLMVTPFVHMLVPWIIQKIRSRKASKPPGDAPVDIELPAHPRTIYTVPGGDAAASAQPPRRPERPEGGTAASGTSAPWVLTSSRTFTSMPKEGGSGSYPGPVSPVSTAEYSSLRGGDPVSPMSTTSHRPEQRMSHNPWDSAAAKAEEPRAWV